MSEKKTKHIVLHSHPTSKESQPQSIDWGADKPEKRGPIVASLNDKKKRNAIGTHSGSYMVYRALAVASGSLDQAHKADLTNTKPVVEIGPFPSWSDPKKIVSLDPYGANVASAFEDLYAKGYDIRPTIAITQAHIEIPEFSSLIKDGTLKPDGKILLENGSCMVNKAAIEPVWYLPGLAERFGVKEPDLRRSLFEQTGGMYSELVTRPDLKVFLPPIGGITVYFMGDTSKLGQEKIKISCSVHDECNGSDVFGSDICTCRPYLIHGIEICVKEAQKGGLGIIVYNRKEGRALGEVTKFLVYNARKRQEGGDTAARYFERTECVAGVQDVRFQELMPDVMHWMGVTNIDKFVSMSDMKYNALTSSGIQIHNRIGIPEDRIPSDAQVEMDAKKAAGYYTETKVPTAKELDETKGRQLDE